MNELVRVSYESNQPTVSGRDLHEALGISTRYNDWFPRMCEYGFVEGQDFYSFLSESSGGRPSTDHQMTIEMAKEICMIQRTEIGKKCREYFLETERRWNSPESVMARAYEFAQKQLASLRGDYVALAETVDEQKGQIALLEPKAEYCDKVLSTTNGMTITAIAKEFGWSGKRMNQFLKDQGIQYKQGSLWLLHQKYAEAGYTTLRTHTHTNSEGEDRASVQTVWTQKGRQFIRKLMEQNGHLPISDEESKEDNSI